MLVWKRKFEITIAQVRDYKNIDRCENDMRVYKMYTTSTNRNGSFTCICIEVYIGNETNCSELLVSLLLHMTSF